jgi:hypothetical protein
MMYVSIVSFTLYRKNLSEAEVMRLKTAVVCEVREGCSMAEAYWCSGFPLTTCGNDGGGAERMTGGTLRE